MKHSSHRQGRRSKSAPSGRVRSLISRTSAEGRERLARAKRDFDERSAAMIADAESSRKGSRKRGVLLAGIGFVALAGMFQLVSSDILAVNFTTQKGQFQLYTNYLDAHKAAGYLDASSRYTNSDGTCPQGLDASQTNIATQTATNGQCGVADLGINSAKLAGLCLIQRETIGGIGNWSLKLNAGQGVATSFTGTSIPTPTSGTLNVSSTDGTIQATSTGIISASNLYVNTNTLGGFGNLISGLYLGQSADTVAASATDANATVSFPSTGSQAPVAGNFGLYADQLNVAGVAGSAYGLQLAGKITLPNLKITVNAGSQKQADC